MTESHTENVQRRRSCVETLFGTANTPAPAGVPLEGGETTTLDKRVALLEIGR
jgi:hypothetical protein